MLMKVNLDKSILFKEKLGSIWKDELYLADYDGISSDIKKKKIIRENANLHQKEAY